MYWEWVLFCFLVRVLYGLTVPVWSFLGGFWVFFYGLAVPVACFNPGFFLLV